MGEEYSKSYRVLMAFNKRGNEQTYQASKNEQSYLNLNSPPPYGVLGIDLNRYSQYKPIPQFYIPVLLHIFLKRSYELCKEADAFLFQQYVDDYESKFIDTGDGGFQVLETPLHALILAINFQTVLHDYNSTHSFRKLRKLIGPINLRYALTYDSVYCNQYQDESTNFYGAAIINNARILSRDTLNRLLMDRNCFEWFMTRINGVENLCNETPLHGCDFKNGFSGIEFLKKKAYLHLADPY